MMDTEASSLRIGMALAHYVIPFSAGALLIKTRLTLPGQRQGPQTFPHHRVCVLNEHGVAIAAEAKCLDSYVLLSPLICTTT